MTTASTSTFLGAGRHDVLTPGDQAALERQRRERLTRSERARENGLPLPADQDDEHDLASGLDPLDRRAATPTRESREVAR
jgi:hypothetical protein